MHHEERPNQVDCGTGAIGTAFIYITFTKDLTADSLRVPQPRSQARLSLGHVREQSEVTFIPAPLITLRRNNMKTLAEIFEHTLQDVYYAENAIVKALPKVEKAATDAKLNKALSEHLEETKGQIKTLDQVFKSIGMKAVGEKCDAIEGLIKEADGLMNEASGTALNAGLLAACQAVEHYEISRYGSLREWAKDLGHDEAHKLLSEILDQEKAANSKLTNLAVTSINTPTASAKAA
jgi:ferritin-like metal-binding protein YciE